MTDFPTFTFTLPWPDGRLSPNHRRHWRYRQAAAKEARKDAYFIAREAGASKLEWASAHLDIVFYPPDNRPRDIDNMLGSLKAALDGIKDASKIDDSLWSMSIRRGPVRKSTGPGVPGGAVEVTMRHDLTRPPLETLPRPRKRPLSERAKAKVINARDELLDAVRAAGNGYWGYKERSHVRRACLKLLRAWDARRGGPADALDKNIEDVLRFIGERDSEEK